MLLRVYQSRKIFRCQACYKYQILKKSFRVIKTVTSHLRAFISEINKLVQHRNMTQKCKQHTYLVGDQKQKTLLLQSTCNDLFFLLINYGILTTWSVATIGMDYAWGMLWWVQRSTYEVQRQNIRVMCPMQKELQRNFSKTCYYSYWIIT